MASDKQTTGLAKWTDKNFIDVFKLNKTDVAEIRNTALELFRDKENKLKDIRDGKPIPEKLNNNFGKEYVEAVAKKLEKSVKDGGTDLRQNCGDENKLLDGLRAFVITAVSRDREKRARASKGKSGSAPTTPKTPGKSAPATMDEESEEEESDSEDEKPPAKKARKASKPTKAPSEESEAESAGTGSVVKSSVTPKVANKTVPGFKASSDVATSTPPKTDQRASGTVAPNTTSLDDELLALAGEDIQVGAESPVASSRFQMSTIQGGSNGLSPQKLQRLTGAVIDAANFLGRDVTEKLVAHTDTGDHAVTDAAIETLTNTLITISRSRGSGAVPTSASYQTNGKSKSGSEEGSEKVGQDQGVTKQLLGTYDEDDKQYGPIQNTPAKATED